jgi:hypothetical protein
MLGADGLETNMTPVMGAEDFSFMLEQKPGAYIWLGAGLQSENLHSPHFDFNDDLLPIAPVFGFSLPNQNWLNQHNPSQHKTSQQINSPNLTIRPNELGLAFRPKSKMPSPYGAGAHIV